MTIDGCRVGRLAVAPDALRVMPQHGGDTGLLRERAMQTVRAVAGTFDGPPLGLPA